MPHSPQARFTSLSDPRTLERFVQNLGEGIYITNEEGEILDANPAFLRIFGVDSLEDLKSYKVSDFVDAEIRRQELELVEREGSTRDRELQITRPDGAVRTVLDTWYLNNDPETGEPIFHGILVDATIADIWRRCSRRRDRRRIAGDASTSTSITSSSITTRTDMRRAIRSS
jgi:PAS domain S-box-containing protein